MYNSYNTYEPSENSLDHIPVSRFKTLSSTVRIHYKEAGNRENLTILLLHDSPSSSNYFRNIIPVLASEQFNFHVIAPDLPGFGATETPPQFKFTFEKLAQSIVLLLDSLTVSQFVIFCVGEFGTNTALHLIPFKQEKVKALIIQNGSVFNDSRTSLQKLDLFQLLPHSPSNDVGSNNNVDALTTANHDNTIPSILNNFISPPSHVSLSPALKSCVKKDSSRNGSTTNLTNQHQQLPHSSLSQSQTIGRPFDEALKYNDDEDDDEDDEIASSNSGMFLSPLSRPRSRVSFSGVVSEYSVDKSNHLTVTETYSPKLSGTPINEANLDLLDNIVSLNKSTQTPAATRSSTSSMFDISSSTSVTSSMSSPVFSAATSSTTAPKIPVTFYNFKNSSTSSNVSFSDDPPNNYLSPTISATNPIFVPAFSSIVPSTLNSTPLLIPFEQFKELYQPAISTSPESSRPVSRYSSTCSFSSTMADSESKSAVVDPSLYTLDYAVLSQKGKAEIYKSLLLDYMQSRKRSETLSFGGHSGLASGLSSVNISGASTPNGSSSASAVSSSNTALWLRTTDIPILVLWGTGDAFVASKESKANGTTLANNDGTLHVNGSTISNHQSILDAEASICESYKRDARTCQIVKLPAAGHFALELGLKDAISALEEFFKKHKAEWHGGMSMY